MVCTSFQNSRIFCQFVRMMAVVYKSVRIYLGTQMPEWPRSLSKWIDLCQQCHRSTTPSFTFLKPQDSCGILLMYRRLCFKKKRPDRLAEPVGSSTDPTSGSGIPLKPLSQEKKVYLLKTARTRIKPQNRKDHPRFTSPRIIMEPRMHCQWTSGF